MNTLATADIRLKCQPGKEGNLLTFSYDVTNQGPAEAYVMDAIAGIDSDSGSVKPNPKSVVVLAGPAEDVIIGRFMAPLPTDRRMAVPVTPLARRLAAGATLQARIEVPLPLAETSPYFGDLPLRQYEVAEIKGVIFTIGYWLAGLDGMAALPLEDAPELFTITTRNTQRSARQVSQRFPTRALQLLKRTDAFPRGLPGAPKPGPS
jgi:hypothetical protein